MPMKKYRDAEERLQETLDIVHWLIVSTPKEVDKEKFELLCNAAGCLQEGQSLLIKGRTNADEER